VERLTQSLIIRLARQGIDPAVIPAFIRNVGRTPALDPMMTIPELNRRISSLGWRDVELDYNTLQLVITNFEKNNPDGFLG